MSGTTQWQEIGWNGIGLQVPEEWHPAVVLSSYLLFEDDYRPVFEIRWQAVQGRLSVQRILRKLERSLDGATIAPWPLPPDWRIALSGRQAHGFTWQQSESGGRGVLLHNPATARSMLLRFHLSGETGMAQHTRVLQSLSEQPQDQDQTWAIFDIRARLPARMHLVGQRFLPGSYSIDLRQEHHHVSLLRFKPAEELLRHQGLAGFGEHLARGASLVRNSEPLTATWQSSGTMLRRLLRRMQGKKAYQMLTLWQIPEKNVILGLRIRSNKPVPEAMVRTIREHYTAL